MAVNAQSGMVVMTSAELAQLLESHVRKVVRDEIAEMVERSEPRFLTTEQVSALLQVCVKTVRKLVHLHGLPVVRQIGPEMRFEREDIVAWMREQRSKSDPERPKLLRGDFGKAKQRR